MDTAGLLTTLAGAARGSTFGLVALALLTGCTSLASGGPTAVAPSEVAPDGPGAAVMVEVIDGDTIDVSIQGRIERIRLIGIDTPETVDERRPEQCYGAEASEHLTELLPLGSTLRLERDEELRDRYDRLLAYVHSADGTFVNLDMVRGGFAAAMPYPPNTSYLVDFEQAERSAEASATGLWGVCGGPDVPLP